MADVPRRLADRFADSQGERRRNFGALLAGGRHEHRQVVSKLLQDSIPDGNGTARVEHVIGRGI